MNHEYIHMHPPSCGDCDADLMAPSWSVRDLIGGAVLFAVAAFIAGFAVARWFV